MIIKMKISNKKELEAKRVRLKAGDLPWEEPRGDPRLVLLNELP